MNYYYEIIEGEGTLPLKTIIHSVDEFQFHWHKELEILFVLEGSVNVRVGEETYYLKEKDIILINCNELHSTKKTKDENMLLVVQINPEFYDNIYPQFNRMQFDCKSFIFGEDEQERFDIIRQYIAKIVWELNKKDRGYQFLIGSYLHLLGLHLVNNFDYTIISDIGEELMDEDLLRLQRIVDYIDQNIDRKITLKEIAEKEHVNYYYLSHFIKNKMGMSFQEYINSIRLFNAVDMLVNSNKAIIDISNTSGFSNVNSFNRIFRDTYNCSPTEYRERYKTMSQCEKVITKNNRLNSSSTYLDVDRTAALEKLFNYLEPIEGIIDHHYSNKDSIEYITVDGRKTGEYFKHHWQELITFGRAAEGLRANWQEQFRELQRDIGFKYIRFHGIFMDEMMIYNISNEGKVEYNWTYVDELFDFFMEMNIKPFVELSFMPEELKRTNETIFWWKGNISPPKDIGLWVDLVQEFVKHCINRYGKKEVETWYFEVWNEPEFENFFWAGSKEEYFEFYYQTAMAIKSISKNLRVGGPAITYHTLLNSSWIEDFIKFIQKEGVPLDFLSIHIYPEYIPEESMKKAIELYKDGVDIEEIQVNIRRAYHGKDHVLDVTSTINEKIETILNQKIEIHITEWNASALFGNLIHDTCYISTYIVKNAIQSIDKIDSLGYWAFTDIFEEHKLGISHFHGGFGLINKDGLKKPSYYAYYLLSKLGNAIIEQGEDYIITREEEDIQILVYNYAYFDDLFLSGDTSHISHKERYLIYENIGIKEIAFSIEDITGDYKITKYKLNRENGSVFDEWVRVGAPENMTREEIEYLKGISQPEMTVEYVNLQGEYNSIHQIPAHGVEMVVLEKII